MTTQGILLIYSFGCVSSFVLMLATVWLVLTYQMLREAGIIGRQEARNVKPDEGIVQASESQAVESAADNVGGS